jgi:hypothetical protein
VDSLKAEQTKDLAIDPPPIARFLEVEDPGDLKISEVGELLKDYRRLAEALRARGAAR